MKKVIALALALIVNAANAHQAVGTSYDYSFGTLKINKNSYAIPGAEAAQSATASVNVAKKELTLTVNYRVFGGCPKGVMCAAAGIVGPIQRPPETLTLPLVDQAVNKCGVIKFAAQKDLRNVDGDLKRIVILDSSKSSCGQPAKNPVTLTLTEQPARSNKNIVSKMAGESLPQAF